MVYTNEPGASAATAAPATDQIRLPGRIVAAPDGGDAPSAAEQVDGGLPREQAEYWQAMLADAPEPLELPADRPRPAQPDHAGSHVRLELDVELTAGLRALGGRHGATLSTTLLAGWAAVLGRLSGQTDLVIGCFGQPLPVRVDLSGSPTAAELVGRVEARVQGALRNGDLSFQRVVELVQPDGADASATPLFRAAFAWRPAPVSAETRSTAGLDLSLEFRAEGDGITAEVVFATALFDRETVERYAGYLRRLLAGMAANETRPVDRLTLLSDEERRLVVQEWNRTEAPYPDEWYIHEQFEAQAARTPDRVAVVYEDRQLTYGELNGRANRLAHHLRSLGVGPDVRVGICVEREPELVVAVLGVLKAGGAYLPLDPGYPRERLLDMVQDCAPVVMVTQGSLAGRLAGLDVPLLALDEDAAWWAGQPDTDPARAALTPEHLTYVIYTSGSTGRPKGVEMTHRGASNLLHWYLGSTAISERDAVMVVTSFSFHLTQRNLMAPLFVGGRVHLAREPFEPGRIAAQIVASGITMMNVTPTGFQALVEADGGQAIGGLRIVIFGGEPLYPRQLARVPEPRPVFLNPYGSTEATGITCHHFARADLSSYSSRSMPPGRPIANARIYVLDAAGEPVPVGVTGELYLAGAGVTRGYRRLPGQTAERFLPDPFGGAPGARLYRTGDLGRWLADGTIEFMGRGDAQVKVRGFRIELGEIEARLAEHAAVHEVVVVARDGEIGDPRLVAYYVGDPAGKAGLRAHLAERLPEYMIPAAFVHMDALPVNPNGKLDRKALPAPDFAPAEETYVAPRTPVEEVLAGIWADVLGVERLGVEESFFELGGHSLLATRVVSRVREVFGVELPLRALFEGPTVTEMAGRVEEMRRVGLPVLPPVVPTERTGAPPLSFAQERLWFIDRMESGSTAYNLPFALRLRGALDDAVLERSLGEIVRRHESLRTVFTEVNGSPVQVIVPFGGFTLPVEDVSGLSEADREATVGRRAGEEAGRAFDLSAGPLFRAALLRLGAEDHVLLLCMHHVVSDGWSMGVLFRELSALYGAYREGGESPLAELAMQYADYAVWQREQVEGEVLDRQLSYWTEQLAGAPELLELPTDRPRPPVRTYRGASVPVNFSPELLERLQALGRSEGATLYMTLLGAFQVLLSRYGGGEDVVVGSPIAGRTRREAEELIGFFVNTLVLRTDLSGDPGFREVLRRVRDVTLGAYEHQEVPFERLVAELQPERSLSHSPLFQVMFTLQNAGGGAALPGLEVSAVDAELASAKFDLALDLAATSRGLRGRLTYGTDLFEPDTIERMVGHLERVLEQAAADADVRLSQLELLGPAERALVLEEWNRTAAEFPADLCIHELFEVQAARTPQAVAVVCEGEALSYAELNARANQLAHYLRRRGVGPEVRVGICLERSLEMVVGILAVLKAGGAYVPLDPAYPAERLAYVLDDSAVPLVLVQAALRGAVPAREGVGVLAVDTLAERLAAEPAENPAGGAGPGSLAYVIYTSGSTGRPKGVMNQHRGVVNRLWWMQAEYGLGADDVVLQKTPFSFDVSVWEFFWPLQQGATLVMARPDGHRDPLYLQEVIERRGVTTLHFVPSMLQQFVETAEAARCTSLRRVICSGEALPPALVARFHQRFPAPVELHNLYGPTEAAVDVSYWACAREDAAGVVPIGRPVWNTALYVLDAALKPVPVGVPGELYIGGVQVARGYLGRSALTAERFVPDPFSAQGGARLYRTGDKSRWRADGAIEYLGRLDFQVKIRGFRIELGEIEAALRQAPGVADCTVVAREDETGDRRLVAYVVGEAEAEALRDHLRQSLPEYMVPSAFVFLEALPLSSNGKLDRKALPAPELASAAERHVAPRTPAEEVLAGIWAEVLRLEQVGVEQGFFELGGHSLLATRVVSRVRELFGVELPLRTLFEGPTVAELAVRVEEMRRAGLPVLPPVVPVERPGALPLSFAQERLLFIDRLEPESALYNISRAWRLAGALDEAALERSLSEIVRRHEALRTTFAEVDGSPVQVIAPFGGFVLPVEDLSGLGEADREAAAGRRASEEGQRPFDLSAGPLFRAALLRLGAEEHVLLLSMHHVVSDGWSMGVLFRELSALYPAYREGGESPLAGLAVQYADYAIWQRGWLSGETLEEQIGYWKEALGGAPPLLEIPTDRPRAMDQSPHAASHAFRLSPELSDGLRALSRREGTTLFMTLLTAWQALLGRHSGQDDVVVGTPVAGRTRGETEGLIGFFVNMLALRADLSGAPTWSTLLGRTWEAALGAYAHQELPFERLVGALSVERSLTHSPLFQTTFTLGLPGADRLALGDLAVKHLDEGESIAKYDLDLEVGDAGGALDGGLIYRTALFDDVTIARMAGHLEILLEAMAADPRRRAGEQPLLRDAERAQVLEAWNATTLPVPEGGVHERFAAQAARTPGAVALVHGAEQLTYAELAARVDRLALRLDSLGVGPETRVGICLERGPWMIAAVLATLTAGGAYVPIDPVYPAERVAYLLEDSGVPVVLTQAALAGRFADFWGTVALIEGVDTHSGPGGHSGLRARARTASPRGLAYVIYTSGSSGTPKGVGVEHASLANYAYVARELFGITPADRVLQFASLSFDTSAEEIYPTLLGGATLVLRTEEMLGSAARFFERCAEWGITVLDLPTAYWHELVAAMDRGEASLPACVRLVVIGGEKMLPEAVAQWRRAVGDAAGLINSYGPTEATVAATVGHVGEGALSIGAPAGNVRVYVLEPSGAPTPVGVPGELYAGGAGVARGYLGRPGLTAERFVPDPFSGQPGARLYRTGDRARWRADGTLEYLGRLDGQVKVRGFRIEPEEIEAVLRGHGAVDGCAVVVREDRPGDRRLVAYVVGGADPAGLREHLRCTLPEYMVPGAFVALDRLPLTPNGKVDRRALPAPELASGEELYTAPRTRVEETLAGIWAELLGLERVGVHDGFFAVGGHSLLAMRLAGRIADVLGAELSVRAVFEAPTIARLAERVEATRGAPSAPAPVTPRAHADAAPLSLAQEGLWFLDQMQPGSALYNVPDALRLSGALDVPALERALGEVVRRHEALRTTLRGRDGGAVQVIAPFAAFALPVDDLSSLDADAREAEARRRAADEAARPFDLAAGPLFRARLLRLADDEHVLLLTLHHVVTDEWSTGVLYRELSALYEAFAEGRESPLGELPVQYADYAAWQRGQLRGAALEGELGWWKTQLAGAPALLELPTDHPRPAVQTYRGANEPVSLDAELMAPLQALARAEGATLYMVLLAAFQVLLSKYSGSEDVVVGSPIAGRTRPEVEGLIGFFINTLALRTDLSGEPSFREVLRRVRTATLGAYEHQEVPFEKLVEALSPERSLSHNPLVQVMFTLVPAGTPPRLGAVRAEHVPRRAGTAKFDMSLALAGDAQGVEGFVQYSTDLFEAATVRRMLGHLQRLLEQVSADADLPLSRVRLLDDAERRTVVETWNRTDAAYPADACIHTLFEAQAERTPHAAAVVGGGTSLSYGELDARANRLANHLVRLGVGPEVRVAVCLEPSPEMIVSVLAVLKAGGAYVPLDPASPVERLRMMLADARVAAVVTQESLRATLPVPDGVRVLGVDGAAAQIAAEPAGRPACGAGPRSLAYVIYTSGSTGVPKGVGVEHRGACNLLPELVRVLGLEAGSRSLLLAPLHFDASVAEIFSALAAGAALYLPDAAEAVPGPGMLALLRRERITHTKFTPSALSALPAAELPDLATLVVGGEACTAELVERWGAGRRFVNVYGPTEATVRVSASVCAPGAGMPAIGRPLANTRLYVLDAAGAPSPVGVPGELYVAGVQLARGYLGRPSLTAASFVPDALGGEPGARLYRTGDRVRWLADGTLEYLGRLDAQVKVRGYRIELGEIDATLRRHAAVRDCAVVAREDVPGDRRLVAYVAGGADAETLRAHLRRSLPEYMVPAAFVAVETLPLTSNGKLDRRALPAPAYAAAEERYVAPRTVTEEVLAGIWAELLRLERVGVHDDFFAVGGHSLLATRLAWRMGDVFGTEVPVRAVLEAPTIAQLAERVEAARGTDAPRLAPVVRVERTEAVPLSFAQERLWFLDQLQQGSAFYTVPAALRLSGALNVPALERALGEIVRRHEALRTVFTEGGGGPVQVIAPFAGFTLPVEDLSALSAAERDAQVARLAGEDATRPFDLAAGPLFRATLLRISDDEHVLLMCVHHVVSDAWSMGVFYRELSALYGAYRQGGESPLPELALQYADYAVWQRQQLSGEVMDRELAWWTKRLSGAPALLELPLDRPRHAAPTYHGADERMELPAALVERLQALARAEGATLYMVLMGAFQVLLGRYAGSEDVVVGSPVAGRTRPEVEGLIGFFVNTLVMRTDLSGDPAFREVLRRVRDTTLGAFEHQDLPFERLVAELHPDRSLAHSPLFQVMFMLAGGDGAPEELLPGVRVSPVEAETPVAKFDLMLSMRPTADGGMSGALVYATDVFDGGTARRMLGHLRRVLEQVADGAGARLSRLELLLPDERTQVVDEWNRTFAPVPAASVHALFAEQAACTPNAAAVTFEDESVTYAELDARANRLANHLVAMGVGPESRVGLCLERGPDLVAAVLAILKAGGAYVPLDPSYPAERLAFMQADSGIAVLLTQESLCAAIPAREGVAVVSIDGDAREIAAREPAIPCFAVPSNGLAYVIYTSGSTGTPKGVAVEHRNVVRLVRGAGYASLGADEVMLQAAPVSFDASTLELWGALLNGGRLVVMPGTSPSLEELGRALVRHGVTTVWLTAGLFQVMVQERLEDLRGVRQLLAGGDVLPVDAVAKVRARFPGMRLINGYGPTENTTFTCCHTVDAGWSGGPVPIGTPVSNTRVYVLDAALRPVPVGVPGELYAGGEGVARGYLGRAALTADRFIPDPFSGTPGARMYRTGDRVRWAASGVVEYLGRLDEQVKVRGFRIELGEIESVLRRHPDVADCTVIARGGGAADKRVIAYVVGRADEDTLRTHLRQNLPEYMVPAAFVMMDALPLTPNGKLDRRALPAPDFGPAEDRYLAPRTPVEEVLAGIWAELLRLERVGVHDDFFALGGHSLLATRLVWRVSDVFGTELSVRALFEAPTVAQLAERVEAARGAGAARLAPVVPVARTEAMPLSFAQERMWFLDQLQRGSAFYNVPAALRLTGALNVAALERALGEVVRRHEVLRTTLRERAGGAVQLIAPFGLALPFGFALPVEDLSALGETEREAEALRRATDEAARPFDLAAGPLFRARLLRLADDAHVLLLTLHHAVTDGWSMGVMYGELSALYEAYADGRESPLAEPPVQYADYAVWQREQLRGETLERQIGYWKDRLSGAPALLELPTDRSRPAVQTYRGANEPVVLDGELLAPLQALARAEGATLYMVVLAAFQTLLARYAGSDDVVVGSPIAGRTRPEVEGLIGFFVNTLVLRTDLSGDPAFREVLRRVRATTLGAYEHQEVPFERLVEELQPERSLSHAPLFQVMFTLAPAGAPPRLGDVRAEHVHADGATAKFDLNLALAGDAGGLEGVLQYATDLFDRATVQRMLGHLRQVLRQVSADADLPVSRLDLLVEAEREVVVGTWSGTQAAYPADAAIHTLFEAQVLRTPDALAATCGTESLTYADLNARANRLAHHLRGLGVGAETRVGICQARGVEMLVSMLAVLKAGGAYVPLDPAYPADRLEFTLRDARVAVLLTQDSLRGLLPVPDGVHVVSVGVAADEIARERAANPDGAPSPRALAYLIYTSGSTGVPKGVAIEHESAVALLSWAADLHTAEELGGMLACTSICFDLSVYELFLPLSLGGRVIIVDNALALPSAPAAGEVRLVNTVPSAAAALLKAGGIPAGVTTINLAGEPLRTELVDALYAHGVGRVIDLYGPSEDTTYSTWTPREAGARATIGRPISNTRAYVLDAGMRPVPAGVPGELYLGGRGLARGYLGRPSLTADRFIPDPFGAGDGGRLYRTGDRVRWTSAGKLEYLGRLDAQVKVRGYRIELGEIDTTLRRHPAVRECVVVAREDRPGEKRLVAYVAADADADTLRTHLRRSVPEYMVPAAFVMLEALPLTPNGKLDRKALPAPDFGPAEDRYVAPRTPVEEALAEIWAEMLRLDRVGVHDHFFEIGGHSLLATRLVWRIQEVMDGDIDLVSLFENPTIGGIAPRLARRIPAPVDAPAVTPAGTEQLLSMLEDLSDEELDRLLGENPEIGTFQ